MMTSNNSSPMFGDGDLSKLEMEPTMSMSSRFNDNAFYNARKDAKESSFSSPYKVKSLPSPSKAHTSPSKNPISVTKLDVLCGRDKVSHAHEGNKRFRKIIEKHREDYQTAQNREKKTSITCKIIQVVQGNGGRFLKKNDSTEKWEVVTEVYAKEKVSHALRSAKDPNRPKVKKRRVIPKYIPTPREEEIFQAALRDQQRIFKSLISKERQGVIEETFSKSLDDSSEFLGLDSTF